MKPFEWVQPDTVADAVAALAHPGSMPLAGGVDLLDRMKEGIDAPSRLVSIRKLAGLDQLTVDASGAKIGANVTLARLAADPALAKSHPMFADAVAHAATPQLRAMATLGGNLAQRTRCWYFRSEAFTCRKKGGNTCFALDGDHANHAIFSNKTCASTYASTLATALVALGARVSIASPGSAGARSTPAGSAESINGKAAREVELAKLFELPETDHIRELALVPGELITHVVIPPQPASLKAAYTKQVAKQSFDWPIVDVAVALVMDGRTCKQANVVMGAVAAAPRHARETERVLTGATVDVITAGRAAKAALAGATPLPGNLYKVPILEAVVARTILAAVGVKP